MVRPRAASGFRNLFGHYVQPVRSLPRDLAPLFDEEWEWAGARPAEAQFPTLRVEEVAVLEEGVLLREAGRLAIPGVLICGRLDPGGAAADCLGTAAVPCPMQS
jgi:hypothetical protein